METVKRKRVKKRNPEVQLQIALDYACTPGLTVTEQRLAQTRITVLSRLVACKRTDKTRRLLAEIQRLTQENLNLTAEVAQREATIQELRAKPVRDTRLSDGRSLAESLREEKR